MITLMVQRRTMYPVGEPVVTSFRAYGELMSTLLMCPKLNATETTDRAYGGHETRSSFTIILVIVRTLNICIVTVTRCISQ